jgi:hypothetical protein
MASPVAYPIMSHQPHLPGNASVADQCRGEAVNRMLSFLSNAVKGIVPIAAAGMQLHARIPDRRVGGVSRFDTVCDCFLYGSTVQPLDAPAEGESDDVRNRRRGLNRASATMVEKFGTHDKQGSANRDWRTLALSAPRMVPAIVVSTSISLAVLGGVAAKAGGAKLGVGIVRVVLEHVGDGAPLLRRRLVRR